MGMFTQLFIVFLLDVLFVGLLVLALVPLALFRKAAFAVMKRNFISYFSTPTGYVFLCLFVLLSSFAAFWPHDFFASNMATLDQLNFWLPIIMLLFIPAITMSIWAEERRQGTDELLLTIPATDLDIVLGKYLASASIFTASLLFSQLANFSVLTTLALGDVDLGLFFTTYIGYWFIGMSMLAIGMVASFLTSNLTVGFILGAVFNAPLALAHYADVIVSDVTLSQAISRWSMAAQFEDFGRGVISISSVMYFSMLIAFGLYLSMVLIGRRHWLGGKDGRSMLGHYLVRVICLGVLVVAASYFFTSNDRIRYDATTQRISSLSPDTRKLIRNLEVDRPVRIEAYVSKTLPEAFIRTKYDLVNLLKELKKMGGDDIQVAINDKMEPFSEEARAAEDQYGIQPEIVQYQAHGAFKQEEVYLAAAFSSGLERVVVPFFGPGTPVEYELVRSIATVADTSESGGDNEGEASGRKTLGIMRTDAQLTGGINFTNFQQTPAQLIVDELKKQYDVEDVDPNSRVDKEQFDVLMVVQPSSLTPPQLDNLLAAIRDGIPTALFEDPAPVRFQGFGNAPFVPGTDMPKRSPGGMFGMNRGPQPKGEISQLWDLLGINMVRALQGQAESGPDARQIDPQSRRVKVRVRWEPFTAVAWQHYNPYPKDPNIPDAAVFANPAAGGADDAFNPDQKAVSGLREVLFMAPGAFIEREDKGAASDLEFIPLVKTGTDTGLQTLQGVQPPGLKLLKDPKDAEPTTSMMDEIRLSRQKADPRLRTTGEQYVLAARIMGSLDGKGTDDSSDEETSDGNASDEDADKVDKEKSDDGSPQIDVILVSDIDMLESLFVRLREQPPSEGIEYQFQNVTFVLNVIDELAGDDRFINVRKRSRQHASLKLIEDRIRAAEREARDEIEAAEEQLNEDLDKRNKERRQISEDLNKELLAAQREGKLDSRKLRELEQKRDWQEEQNKNRTEKDAQRVSRQLQSKLREIRRDLDLERRQIQNQYKFWAVVIPPLPPLFVGLAVFLYRRLREREGASPDRLR